MQADPDVLMWIIQWLPILVLFAAVLGFVFWAWVLVDCATKESPDGNTKVVWVLIVVFTNIVGAALYFLFRRPARRRELGR